MIYAVNAETKEHRVFDQGKRTSTMVSACLGIDEFLVEADADGWIEWSGGDCPLPELHPCEVKNKAGEVIDFNCAGNVGKYNWKNEIIAYRPIPNHPEQPKEWRGTEDSKSWNGVGFPDSGLECEALILADSIHKDWVKGVSEGMVRMPSGRFGCVFNTATCRYLVGGQDEFRPFPTDRERWIEAATDMYVEDPDAWMGKLFDAGLARLPEE